MESKGDKTNWVEFKLDGETPSRRAYHASFIYGEHLYIFMEVMIFEREQRILCGELISAIEIRNQNGKECLSNKSKSPGAIAFHTMTLVGEKAYLLGGSTLGVDSTRDYVLDVPDLEWNIIERKGEDAPSSIDEHSANLYGDQILIFGGNVSGSKSNILFTFHLKHLKWNVVASINDGPWERSCHSAVIYSDCLYIFGGKDHDCNKLDDFWQFDIKKKIWTELKKTSDTPLKRSGHSAVIYKNFMIIFGGIHELTQELNDMHIFDFNNGQWFAILNEAESPSPHATGFGEHKSFTKSFVASSGTKLVGSNRGSVIKDEKETGIEFGISIQKTVKKRSRKSNLFDYSGHLSISKLEKIVNK